ncbi:MAG: error-prone DNA polymerase [Chloroflexi bacterium]|nr:error-prone DNA polymerase [Chloroflexota bacterium]
MYSELHCHTYYSLLDGASSPATLLARAAALGMPALALTDHDGLYGAVEFWRAARERGIRPVIGAEVTLAHGSHLTLLAETQAGYANLSRLISVGQLAGTKGAPVLTIEDVARHAGGLLCLSGCRQGAVAQAVLAGDAALTQRAAGKLADIFGRDRFWIELQRHWLPDDDRLLAGLLAAAERVGVGVVATNNVHYATPDGHRLHDVLTAIRHNMSLADLGPRQRPNSEFYLKGAAEMAALFAEHPAALAATQAIAERCDVSLDFSRRRLPAFPPSSPAFPDGIPPGETAFSTLYALAHAGLIAKYRPITPPAVKQLAHELAVIEAVGLADYFLIVGDIVREARARGIRCQGRGSAANSLVAYLLGITPVDPLAHNLLFERFLSDRTDTMPDIDLDFARDRRDEVIAYVYERYGREHTALVCNVVTYQPRLAVRDAARALGFPAEELNRVAAWAEEQRRGGAGETGRWGDTGAQERSQLPASSIQLLTDLAAQMIGVPRHLSVHAGGMLVTAQPLVEVVPLEHATKPGVVVAQWNKDSIEDAGLIKTDLLSLATLGMITEACAWVERRHGITLDLDGLPLDDPAVYRLLAEGDTIGCFQVESRAQSSMLPRLKPQRFEDLIIEVAIVRPGPIQGGMVHPYLRRRQGLEPVTYLHPSLEPALRETLGVVIFQEQVLRVAMALAGFTPGEADLLRRAMSRSRSTEAMISLRARFLAGAQTNGVALAVAEEVFTQLQGFATYGFCKSHAASFALIAYQTLWLKAHYPAEFYCAILNHQPLGFYAPEVVVGDAKRHGITVLRPDVNASEDGCTLEPGSEGEGEQEGKGAGERGRASPLLPCSTAPLLRLGLRYLAGLGAAGRARLLAARGSQQFTDLADFGRRTRLPRPLVGDLIRAGALDCFGVAKRQLLWALGGLPYAEDALIAAPDTSAELPDLTEREAMGWDYELLGLAPDDHPLRLWRARLRAQGAFSAAELATQPAGKIVKVAGMVVVRQAPPTAKGHLFITLEDETGLVNLIVRPDLVTQTIKLPFGRAYGLNDWEFVLATGVVQRQGSAVNVVVTQIRPLTPANLANVAADPAHPLPC